MIDNIIKWLREVWQSFLSIVKVVLQSKIKTKLPVSFSNKDELLILANGPSLNKTIEESSAFVQGKTLLAVNFSVLSPLYEQLKPELYLIADPLFWIVPEKREKLFQTMVDKTTWDISFFIPRRATHNKEWQPIIAANPHIKVYIYNATPIEGFQGLCNYIFKKGWGVPRPHNVLIPSIAIGLRLPFRTIYLAGADHSWLPEITVTENNEVLMHQKHFYDTNTSKAEMVLKENLETQRLYHILHHMSVAFKSYFVIKDYATYLHKEIINVTPGSYIDAFKRMKI